MTVMVTVCVRNRLMRVTLGLTSTPVSPQDGMRSQRKRSLLTSVQSGAWNCSQDSTHTARPLALFSMEETVFLQWARTTIS